MTHEENMKKVTHLMCREIQAPLVSTLIKGFGEEIGMDRAMEIAKEIIEKDGAASGKALAEQFGGNTIAVLAKLIREYWAADGTMEIDFLEETEHTLHFDVKRCGYADMYERLGIKEMGCVMSCCRDFTFMDGFNPDIVLKRTKTLMENDDCCDFRYEARR